MNTWDLYFATMAGWMMHPGYCKDGMRAPSLEQCADMADEMIRIRDEGSRMKDLQIDKVTDYDRFPPSWRVD